MANKLIVEARGEDERVALEKQRELQLVNQDADDVLGRLQSDWEGLSVQAQRNLLREATVTLLLQQESARTLDIHRKQYRRGRKVGSDV